jgi:hypothetical protein
MSSCISLKQSSHVRMNSTYDWEQAGLRGCVHLREELTANLWEAARLENTRRSTTGDEAERRRSQTCDVGTNQRDMERERWSRRTGSSPGSFIYGRGGRRCSRTMATTATGIGDRGLDWHDWGLPVSCVMPRRINTSRWSSRASLWNLGRRGTAGESGD